MNSQRAQGYALLVMLLLMATMGGVYLTHALNKNYSSSTMLREQREAQRGLRDAQLALIARALIEDNTPGTLPAPSGDLGEANELNGKHDTGYAYAQPQKARRFPWFSLGLPQQTGGYQQCLWYILGGTYSNLRPTEDRNKDKSEAPAINPTTAGSLQLSDGSLAAAIIFAPGIPLGFQNNRGASGAHACPSGAISDYLEAGNATSAGPFNLNSNPLNPATYNDTIQPISHTQLLRPVLRRVLKTVSSTLEMRSLLKNGLNAGHSNVAETRITNQDFDTKLAALSTTSTKSPALTSTQPACSGISENALDNNGTPKLDTNGVAIRSSYYTAPVSWLCFNDWYSHMKYLGPENSIEISLNPAANYQCRLNLDNWVISCG